MATVIEIGVARPTAQGQAMINTAIGVEKRVREPRLRTEKPPRERRHDGDGYHDLDEVRRDDIGEPLDRRARALRFAHHVNDARQQRVRAHAFGADEQ